MGLPDDIQSSQKIKQQLELKGLSLTDIQEQVSFFNQGMPPSKLVRAATVGDGIRRFPDERVEALTGLQHIARDNGRFLKFVPASGAASRMFKALQDLESRQEKIDFDYLRANRDSDRSALEGLTFFENLDKFAFYEDLNEAVKKDGQNLSDLLDNGRLKEIMQIILKPEGLGYSDFPKGMIPFHKYQLEIRTAVAEHFHEAIRYVQDSDGTARLHFTVQEKHRDGFEKHIEQCRQQFTGEQVNFEVSISSQRKDTETLAVTLEDRPLLDEEGLLLFRPGGHGALLYNLLELEADLVYIKNIDNVIPANLFEQQVLYKQVLGGILVEIQDEIFGALRDMEGDDISAERLRAIAIFSRDNLNIDVPDELFKQGGEELKRFLAKHLNRPLRVCGMVKNEGEPGGGPFWVEDSKGQVSLQIVESAQVDLNNPDQKDIFESSTHFNPVDIVTGLRDYRGKPFDLLEYRDMEAGIITVKSRYGREIKAMELPGLWNGSMAHFNTVFVEIPIETFNPVKTVNDLLRPRHQQTGV
ncbi:MAG: DUF4301 family protein [candidate division Zixibacteria bacterium]|nr:DUF4301 family protein [candidate division Zixibacteria bacterium]